MPRPCHAEQLGGAKPAGDEDCPGRNRRLRCLTRERIEQACGEIFEVGQPLPQIRVRDTPHAVAQLAGNPLHGGLGAQPARDDVGRSAEPAGVGRDQLVGLQDLTRGGCVRVRAALGVRRAGLDELVQSPLHPREGVVEPPHFRLGIVGQQTMRHDARAVQDHRSHRDAGHERRRGEDPRNGRADAFLRTIERPGRSQDLGQQHGHRLQNVDLLFGKEARGPVLSP